MAKETKAFTKGQRVTLINSWNGKDIYSVTPAIVHSCGTKQMVLTHAETGEELGRHFRPVRQGWSDEIVLNVDEDAKAIALELAKAMREKFISDETATIAKYDNGDSAEYWNKRRAILAEIEAREASIIER